jgi:hypothetical protein
MSNGDVSYKGCGLAGENNCANRARKRGRRENAERELDLLGRFWLGSVDSRIDGIIIAFVTEFGGGCVRDSCCRSAVDVDAIGPCLSSEPFRDIFLRCFGDVAISSSLSALSSVSAS